MTRSLWRRIYKHHEIQPRGPYFRPTALINRMTSRTVFGDLERETWLILLPNWGMAYWPPVDDFRWSRLYVARDSVSGSIWRGGIPVED